MRGSPAERPPAAPACVGRQVRAAGWDGWGCMAASALAAGREGRENGGGDYARHVHKRNALPGHVVETQDPPLLPRALRRREAAAAGGGGTGGRGGGARSVPRPALLGGGLMGRDRDEALAKGGALLEHGPSGLRAARGRPDSSLS